MFALFGSTNCDGKSTDSRFFVPGRKRTETQIGALILDRNPDFVWELSREGGGRSGRVSGDESGRTNQTRGIYVHLFGEFTERVNKNTKTANRNILT